MAKLKEHHILGAEELARNQSIRQVASSFGVDQSTLRYRLYRHKEVVSVFDINGKPLRRIVFPLIEGAPSDIT